MQNQQSSSNRPEKQKSGDIKYNAEGISKNPRGVGFPSNPASPYNESLTTPGGAG
jgi:hypothetical protein